MKTIFNWICNDWTRVKNHCRRTVNKEFTDKKPSEKFMKELLIAEHSPIRLLEFDWTWRDIPYWVHAEWARHKFEKFITSQRDDRVNNEIPRGKKPQESPVTFDGFMNMQNGIDAWRKRLCFQATNEARELGEDFKITLHEEGYKNEAAVLVPNCVYRCGCPEMSVTRCGFFNKFKEYCEGHNIDITDIQSRYDAYNEMFYNSRKKEKSND